MTARDDFARRQILLKQLGIYLTKLPIMGHMAVVGCYLPEECRFGTPLGRPGRPARIEKGGKP
jgi:hypothetical protein